MMYDEQIKIIINYVDDEEEDVNDLQKKPDEQYDDYEHQEQRR